MTPEKLTILCECRNMIIESWTFERLTKEEQDRLLNKIFTTNNTQLEKALKGTRSHCWDILHSMYTSYLVALDYKPSGWREEKESEAE